MNYTQIEQLETIPGASIQYVCASKLDSLNCDLWIVAFPSKRQGQGFQTFEYYTGLGLRYKQSQPVTPKFADLLYCVITDYDSAQQSFHYWCHDLGYDTDSMKAFGIYRKCVENGEKLAQCFTHSELEQIKKLLADY